MDFTIRHGASADILSLAPLWLDVHEHHSQAMPHLKPYVSPSESWHRRRAMYTDLFSTGSALLTLGESDEGLVGYGMARIVQSKDTWMHDTWQTRSRIGGLETLATSPIVRGHGLGTAIFRDLEARLVSEGVDEIVVGALSGNSSALRLYTRLGFSPAFLYLTSTSRSRTGGGQPPRN